MTIFDRIFRRTDDEDEYIYNRRNYDDFNRYEIDASTYVIRDVEDTYRMVENTKKSKKKLHFGENMEIISRLLVL